jgi:hypothetical protein
MVLIRDALNCETRSVRLDQPRADHHQFVALHAQPMVYALYLENVGYMAHVG